MKFIEVKKQTDKEFPGYTLRGNDPDSFVVPRMRTGIFTFDLLTGGGLPVHTQRFIEYYGKKSSGKSTKLLKDIGIFLETFPDEHAVLVDFEHTYDEVWARNFIPEYLMPRFHVLDPDFGEIGIDLMLKYFHAEDLGLVGIDSIANMVPTAEGEASASNDFVGLQARLINKMIRRILPLNSQRRRGGLKPVTIVLVNQIRTKVGGSKFQTMAMSSGGNMKEHNLSLQVRFYTKEYKKRGDTPIKVQHLFTVEKNKVGLPKRSGEYWMTLLEHDGMKVGDIDEVKVVVEYAKRAGIIQREGTEWRVGKNKTFPNLNQMNAFFAENKNAFDKLKEKTLTTYLNNPLAGAKDSKSQEDSSEEE